MKGLPDPQHTIKRICATNKYAKSSYEIGKKFEAGISLVGTEVGPVASGQCQLRDAYCRVRDGELWIHNLFIGPHKTTGKYFQHVEKRPRRLLVHKKEVLELMYASARDGQTIVPLKIYLTATHRYVRKREGKREGRWALWIVEVCAFCLSHLLVPLFAFLLP
jgi:SsrA-binding protein